MTVSRNSSFNNNKKVLERIIKFYCMQGNHTSSFYTRSWSNFLYIQAVCKSTTYSTRKIICPLKFVCEIKNNNDSSIFIGPQQLIYNPLQWKMTDFTRQQVRVYRLMCSFAPEQCERINAKSSKNIPLTISKYCTYFCFIT